VLRPGWRIVLQSSGPKDGFVETGPPVSFIDKPAT
jgi:hypothetical protein